MDCLPVNGGGTASRFTGKLSRFVVGNTCAQACTELHKFTLILLAVGTLSASSTQMGFVGAAPFAGLLCCGLVAGALCERFDVAKVLVVVSAVKAVVVVAGAFSVALSWVSVEFAVGALFVFSVCDAFYAPSFVAYLSKVSVDAAGNRDGDLVSGRLAMTSTVDQVVRVLVPAATGTIVGLVGSAVLLGVAGGFSFLSAVCFVSLVGGQTSTGGVADSSRRQVWAAVWSGVTYVSRDRVLRALVAVTGVMNFVAGVLVAVLPLYALRLLGLSQAEFGFAMGTGAIAGLVAGYLSHRLAARIGRFQTMCCALACLPGAYLLLVVPGVLSVQALWWVCLSEAVFALVILVFSIQSATVISVATPDLLLARTASIRQVVSVGAFPVGSLAGGVLAGVVGVFTTVVVALVAAGLPLILLLLSRDVLKRGS